MKKIYLLLILLPIGLHAQEQKQSYSFNLQEAIDYAIKHNYSTINANRDVEAAKKKKWETTTIGLPQIHAGVDYFNNLVYTRQGVSGNAFDPTGDPNKVNTVVFGTKHSMNAKATLSQLVFDGSYLIGLRSAETYLKISENAKVKTEQEIKEMVINTYANILLAKENIQILEKNKKVLKRIYDGASEMFKNGLIEEESKEQLQIMLSSLENSLNYSIRIESITSNMLKLILGIELENKITLTDNLSALVENNISLNLLQEPFDVTNNIDYKIGQNLSKSKRLLVLYEKSKAIPSLGLAYNFGYNSFANQFTFTDNEQKWNNFSNIGVGLSIPVFSSFGQGARVQQAKIALEQSKTQLKETEQKLKLEFEKTKSEYEFSLDNYATATQNLKLAERIESKQEIKFKEGISTSFDFLNAQEQLYSKQQEYLKSMIDVLTKKANLDKLLNKN